MPSAWRREWYHSACRVCSKKCHYINIRRNHFTPQFANLLASRSLQVICPKQKEKLKAFQESSIKGPSKGKCFGIWLVTDTWATSKYLPMSWRSLNNQEVKLWSTAMLKPPPLWWSPWAWLYLYSSQQSQDQNLFIVVQLSVAEPSPHLMVDFVRLALP